MAVTRGTGGPAGDRVEALPKPNSPGFFLQSTLVAGLPAPPLGPVPPSAVAGAPLIDLRLTPGALPSFMSGPLAQADFAARFGPGQQFLSAGERVIQWQSQIPNGGTFLIPIEATPHDGNTWRARSHAGWTAAQRQRASHGRVHACANGRRAQRG